jgi:hypothetical protein
VPFGRDAGGKAYIGLSIGAFDFHHKMILILMHVKASMLMHAWEKSAPQQFDHPLVRFPTP